MMTNDELWAEYARLSEISRYLPVSNRLWAIDDALSYILDQLESGQPERCSAQRIENRIRNATAKFRNRGMLEAKYLRPADPPQHSDARLEIDRRLARCTPNEQKLLLAVGMGYRLTEIAQEMNAPLGTIKTQTFRARLKFRVDQLEAA